MNFPDKLPEDLWGFPTGATRESLAARFDLPLHDSDQDWEWTNSRLEQLPRIWRLTNRTSWTRTNGSL